MATRLVPPYGTATFTAVKTAVPAVVALAPLAIGGAFTVVGTQWQPNRAIQILWGSGLSPTLLITVTTDAFGNFVTPVMPPWLRAGAWLVTARDYVSSALATTSASLAYSPRLTLASATGALGQGQIVINGDGEFAPNEMVSVTARVHLAWSRRSASSRRRRRDRLPVAGFTAPVPGPAEIGVYARSSPTAA